MKWFERIKGWFGGTAKSNNSLGIGLRSVLSGSAAGGWASDHREETAHNTGFNYIAIHAIASQVAAATVTVFADGDQSYLRKSRRKTLAAMNGTFSRWKSTYGADDRTTDPLPPQHPLVQLLKRPNPQESGAHFRYRQAQQLRLTGTCLIWNVPGQTGSTCERYVIPTAMATPVAPTNDLPRGGWRINPVASRYTPIVDDGYVDCPSWYRILGQILDANQIQVIRLPHAWYLDDGQSPLSAGAKWVDAGEAVDDARYHQLKNGIDPSVVWNLPPDVSPDQDEIDRVQAKISAKYGGPQNVGRVMIAQSGTTITPLTTSPKDMCYTEGFQDFKAAVLALHQTPPVAVGLQEPGAYAAYNASMKAWRHAAIQPLCDMLAEADTEWLAPQFGEGLTIELESDSVEDAELLESQLQNDLAAGARTRNEWRAIRGLPPLPEPLGSQLAGTAPTTSAESLASSSESTDDPESAANDDSSVPYQSKAISLRSYSDDEAAERLGLQFPYKDLPTDDATASDWDSPPDRAMLIAEILYGLFGENAASVLDADSDADNKTFDQSLHPRDELGRFTSRGNSDSIAAARETISRILQGQTRLRSDAEVAQSLNLLTTPQLVSLHREHGVSIPSQRHDHLVEHVRVRLMGFPDENAPPRWPSSEDTVSSRVHVFVQHEQELHRLLGRRLKSTEWGQLVGAQPGARVHVYPKGLAVEVSVEHPLYFARQALFPDHIYLADMEVSPKHQGEGIGCKILSEQVRKAKELDFHQLELTAIGSGPSVDDSLSPNNTEAGYYAWARLGFDGRVAPLMQRRSKGNPSEKAIAADFKQRFPDVKNVSEMMLTPERRDWWRNYGGEFEGKFNLHDGSQSLQVLEAYHAEVTQRGAHKSLFELKAFEENETAEPTVTSGEFSGILSQEDEAILDKIWLAIGRNTHSNSDDDPEVGALDLISD